jgi:nicotinate-nucleotide adenylyltransferase
VAPRYNGNLVRIAIFGGTFDPIHSAHIAIAREARLRFSLDEVWIVPASNPPHKKGAGAGYEHRYRMVELACAGEAGLKPSRLEEAERYNYSIDTIERVMASHPGCDLYFLIGADAFAEIRTWRRWRDVVANVTFLVVLRPGHAYEIPEGAKVEKLETLALPVSSSGVRQQLVQGQSPPVLPPTVLAYIREHGLYRESGVTTSLRNSTGP